MDQGIRNPVLRILVYGHVWLACGAAAQAWWMAELLDLDQRWPVAVFAACATFGSYSFMRLVRGGEAGMLEVPQLAWVRQHRMMLLPSAAASLLIAASIMLLERERFGPWAWLFAALAAFYVVPLRGRGRVFGLRWVPGLKADRPALVGGHGLGASSNERRGLGRRPARVAFRDAVLLLPRAGDHLRPA
jgi:hypothetical protein